MRIVLTHIPRTGGTSLFSALRDQLPDAKAAEFDSLSQVALMGDKELNSYELISTYIGSKLFDRLVGPWTKIVILRDPVARLKSSYWNLRSNSRGLSFAGRVANSLGFREYLASRDNTVMVHATNVQAWTVLGDKSIWFREQFAQLSDNEICRLSLLRLSDYDFTGFTEDLDDLWRRICRHFVWPNTALPRLRANPFAIENTDVSSQEMGFHTALDSEFVRQARSLQGSRDGTGETDAK